MTLRGHEAGEEMIRIPVRVHRGKVDRHAKRTPAGRRRAATRLNLNPDMPETGAELPDGDFISARGGMDIGHDACILRSLNPRLPHEWQIFSGRLAHGGQPQTGAGVQCDRFLE